MCIYFITLSSTYSCSCGLCWRCLWGFRDGGIFGSVCVSLQPHGERCYCLSLSNPWLCNWWATSNVAMCNCLHFWMCYSRQSKTISNSSASLHLTCQIQDSDFLLLMRFSFSLQMMTILVCLLRLYSVNPVKSVLISLSRWTTCWKM